ncbi:hypothetical protein FOZ62_011274, partial [Perkinsus olseni]
YFHNFETGESLHRPQQEKLADDWDLLLEETGLTDSVLADDTKKKDELRKLAISKERRMLPPSDKLPLEQSQALAACHAAAEIQKNEVLRMKPSSSARPPVGLCRPPARLHSLPRIINRIVQARLRTAFTALSPTLEDYLTEPLVRRSSPQPIARREDLHQRVGRIDDLLACLQPALRRLRHYAARRRRLRELLQGSIRRYHNSLLIRVMDAWSCLASVRREEAFLWARVRTRVDLRVAAGVFTKWYRMTVAFSLGRSREISRFFQPWKRRSLGLARLERWYERRSLLAILEGWAFWRAAF